MLNASNKDSWEVQGIHSASHNIYYVVIGEQNLYYTLHVKRK